jgi:hypothetical protein
MIQFIIVLLIVSGAIAIALYRIYRSVSAPDTACNSCASKGCNGCGVADLKKEIEAKQFERNKKL